MSNNVQVNGDVPHSAFIEHLLAYPVVNDSVSTFKANPYGQKSLELTDSAYRTFAAPFLPYFSKPFQYVSPYVKKADDLGDKTLSTLDEKFPIVKKPTNEIVGDAKKIAMFPLRVGQTGKEHVLSTYEVEFKKVEGNSLVSYGKAALTTVLIITTETLTTVSNYFGNRKNQARQAIEEKANN
ncbi:hypothetical protein OQA88_5042 [Cercophora sp. LCS_1]